MNESPLKTINVSNTFIVFLTILSKRLNESHILMFSQIEIRSDRIILP